MIESMIMGAFPIQTNPGGATEEWISDGNNGFLVPHDDPEQVARAIERAIADDTLVDSAATKNLALTKERIDFAPVRRTIIGMYEEVVNLTSL
jgi:glycosyltransferase involved in cell wall biosynthesis